MIVTRATSIRVLLLPMICAGILDVDTGECDSYQLSLPFTPGESCREIYEWNPQTHNRSAYYWLLNPPRHVYCDMEQRVECDNIGGWTRIASVNIAGGDDCPTGWEKRSIKGISFCRSLSDSSGCYPAIFSSKEISYQKICGMARGYQKGTTDAFRRFHNITDGLSIIHGDPHQHIWSYIAGYTDGSPHDSSCPCAGNQGSESDSFIGSNYYCESGSPTLPNSAGYYLSDPLWDGFDCPDGNTCCDDPNLPWFYRELDTATTDDIEVFVCTDQSFRDEAVLVDQLELYVQ